MSKSYYSTEYVYDKEDKNYLDTLTPLEREKELAQRAEAAENKRELQRIRQLKNASSIDKSTIKGETDRLEEISPVKLEGEKFVITRSYIYSKVFNPHFSVLKKGYVKVKIGTHYEICKIIDIVKVAPYKLRDIKNKTESFMVNVGLKLQGYEKVYENLPIINISDNQIHSDELQEFFDKNEINQMTFEEIKRRYRSIISVLDRGLTTTEVEQQIKNREILNPKPVSITQIKIELTHKREAAFRNENYEEYMKCQKKLEEVEDNDRYRSYLKEFGKDVAQKKMKMREEYLAYLHNPRIVTEAPHLMKETLKAKSLTEGNEKGIKNPISNYSKRRASSFDNKKGLNNSTNIPFIELPSEKVSMKFKMLNNADQKKVMNDDIDVLIGWYDEAQKKMVNNDKK